MTDESTLKLPRPSRRTSASQLVAITLVAHPDLTRWGDTAMLEERTVVTRHTPAFTDPASRHAPRAIDVPYVSRRPVIEIEGDYRGVVIRGVHEDAWVVVDGVPLREPRVFGESDLDRGILVELEDQVGLFVSRREAAPKSYDEYGLIGIDPSTERLREQVAAVAPLSMSVLLRGETGTGKERVAAAVHAASLRSAREMLAVNIAAVDPSVLASELFGHVRGAFTGASDARRGYFREASGSTLFLDEIGEAGAEVQRSLLRALESHEVIPVGSDRAHPVDARIIAATDADLERDVAEQRFRAPLLHRLAQYEIDVAPLRDRRVDVAVLFAAFVREQLAEMERPLPDAAAPAWVRSSTVRALLEHPWPGNVRELRNVAGAAVVRSLSADHLALPPLERARHTVERPAKVAPLGGARRTDLGALDPSEWVAVLEANAWRPEPSAKALGIAKSSLYQLIKAHPDIPSSQDLSREAIESALAEAEGDTHRAAMALRVPQRGLLHRMKKLGMR